jgi:hypothetical protein
LLPVVPAVPGVPCAEELSALPAAELAVRLAEAYELIGELTAQVGRLSAQVDDLKRQARRDDDGSGRKPLGLEQGVRPDDSGVRRDPSNQPELGEREPRRGATSVMWGRAHRPHIP